MYCLDAGFLAFDFGAFAAPPARPADCVVEQFDILRDVDEVCGVWGMDTVKTDTDGYECWKSTRFDLVLVFAMQMIDDEERTSGREWITRYILIEKWCSEDFHTENRSSVNEQKMVHITYRQCHCC